MIYFVMAVASSILSLVLMYPSWARRRSTRLRIDLEDLREEFLERAKRIDAPTDKVAETRVAFDQMIDTLSASSYMKLANFVFSSVGRNRSKGKSPVKPQPEESGATQTTASSFRMLQSEILCRIIIRFVFGALLECPAVGLLLIVGLWAMGMTSITAIAKKALASDFLTTPFAPNNVAWR